jgi:hypothetical protein
VGFVRSGFGVLCCLIVVLVAIGVLGVSNSRKRRR